MFRLNDQQEVVVALLSPIVLATPSLSTLESYRCACCGYSECYDGQQRLTQSTNLARQTTPGERWQRVDTGGASTRGRSAPHEFSMRECPKCGTRVRQREECHLCGEGSVGDRN